jgi:hypothetical protein
VSHGADVGAVAGVLGALEAVTRTVERVHLKGAGESSCFNAGGE